MMSARVTACTSCRQVKLKCDVKETQPDPCTRCRTKKLSCKMDANFKRVPTRGRLAEVTKKLNTLQEVLATVDPTHPSLAAGESSTITGHSSHTSMFSHHATSSSAAAMGQPLMNVERSGVTGSSQGDSLSPPQVFSNLKARSTRSGFFLDSGAKESQGFRVGEKQLGDVRLSELMIFQLFVHFHRFRHPHLPIVNTDVTVTKLYDSCPFLFWTIIHVSCRHNPEYSQLEQSLTAPYRELLATTLVTAVRNLQTIQGLLLISLYPFNSRHQHEDPGLNLCGFALSACIQMGLHRPDYLHDYGIFAKLDIADSGIESKIMTWMALFQVSTFLCLSLGIPPLMQSPAYLEGIRLMGRNPSIPQEFVAQIEIQRHTCRFVSSLDEQTDLQTRFTLTQVFDRELDALRIDFKDSWSGEAEFKLLVAKLYLYAMFIAPTKSPEEGSAQKSYDSVGPSRRIILHLGLATAGRLVRVFPASTAVAHNIELYPKWYFRSIVFTACFLLYFLLTSSSSNTSPEDTATARNYINEIHGLFRTFDIKYGTTSATFDVYRHAAETTQLLREAVNDEDDQDNSVIDASEKNNAFKFSRVESRMGANIFYKVMKEAYRRKALRVRKMQLKESQQEQEQYSRGDLGLGMASEVLMDWEEGAGRVGVEQGSEGDFLWQEQLEADWNLQLGVWGLSWNLEGSGDMSGFEQ